MTEPATNDPNRVPEALVAAQLRVAAAVEQRKRVIRETGPLRRQVSDARRWANETEEREKAAFAQAHPIGTTLIVTTGEVGPNGRPVVLGKVQVKEAPTVPDQWVIDDEQAVIAWMLPEWGTDCVEQRLKEPYKRDAIAMAQAAVDRGESMPAGIAQIAVPPGDPVVAWIPAAGFDAAVLDGLTQRALLPTNEPPGLEGPTE